MSVPPADVSMFHTALTFFQQLVEISSEQTQSGPVSPDQARKILDLEATFASGKWLDISHFRLDINDYEIGKKISQTPDGVRVRKGLEKATGKEVALKQFRDIDWTEQTKMRFQREVAIMGNLSHPALMNMYGYAERSDKELFIVMPFMKNGSLASMLSQSTNWTPTQKHIILYGVARAMSFLHACHIMHRNLSLANILLDDDLEPKVADFNMSKYVEDTQSLRQSVASGTPRYVAPEIWRSGDRYGFDVDVYAFGMIMYAVLVGNEPFPKARTQFEIAQSVTNEIRPLIPSSVPENYAEIITKCWDDDPSKRPRFSDIVTSLEKNFLTIVDQGQFAKYREKLDHCEQGVVGRTFPIVGFYEKIIQTELASLSKELCELNAIVSVAQKRNICSWLSQKEKKEKKSLFTLKLSSNDLYGMLDPDSPDSYRSAAREGAWIELSFKKPIEINGITFVSLGQEFSTGHFDVQFYKKGKRVHSEENVGDDTAKCTCTFGEILVDRIRITARGKHADGSCAMRLGGIELQNGDGDAIIREMFGKYRDNIRDVIKIRARDFDTSLLYDINRRRPVSTWDSHEHEWVEVAFHGAKVIVSEYTIRKHDRCFKSWSLRGSNNPTLDVGAWHVIDRQAPGSDASDAKTFTCEAQVPFKYFRLVAEEPEPGGRWFMNLNYFDITGLYVLE